MTTVFVYEYVTAGGAKGEPFAPSLLAEGRAMRDAALADFAAVPDVRVLSLTKEDEPRFRQCASRADFTLVIAPETQGILEERCRWALEAGSRLLGPSVEAIHLTADKLALAEHFERSGVPHPCTWPLGGEPRDQFPMVWKPRDGAGSQNTYLLLSAADRERAKDSLGATGSRYASPAALIAQEYVAGQAVSVAFLIGSKQRLALLPCRQNLSNDGRLTYLGGSLPLPGALSSRAVAMAERAIEAVPGLFGYVGVDLVLADDPRRDCIIEINPRLTTSYVGLRRSARFNIAEALLSLVQGESAPDPMWWLAQVEFLPDGKI